MQNFDESHVLGKPDVHVKGMPCYTERRCNDWVAKAINNEIFFKIKAKKMSEDYVKATEIVDKAQSGFDCSLKKLMKSEDDIASKTKRVSEDVRKSTAKLGEGLARIEKLANFDRLEKYVELLERAEKAINSLAELEKTGRLEKIASAIN